MIKRTLWLLVWQPAIQCASLFRFFFTLNQFLNRRHVQTCGHYGVHATIRWRQKLSVQSHTHTVTAGLSAEDRYEKGVVLTHWLGGMLQPQHLTGPYLPWADCTAWYVSVIFVGKKDTAVRARWVKKTGQWHKLTSLRFLHDHDHLLVCVDSLLEKMLNTNTVMDAWHLALVLEVFLHVGMVIHLITDCAYMPAQVYILVVVSSCTKTRSWYQTVIIPSWTSP